MPHSNNIIKKINIGGTVYEIHDEQAIHDLSDIEALGLEGAFIFKGVVPTVADLPDPSTAELKVGYVYHVSADSQEYVWTTENKWESFGSVKTVNGVAPDENGNINVPNPDWNTLLNRPFGEETTKTLLCDVSSDGWSENTETGVTIYGAYITAYEEDLSEGDTCLLVVDGTEYTGVLAYNSNVDRWCFGDVEAVLNGDYNEFVYTVVFDYDNGAVGHQWQGTVSYKADSAPTDCKLYKITTETKTIDPKFLPEAVRPDYTQNDPTQPDYIKNRPFYVGDLVETELADINQAVTDAGTTWGSVSDDGNINTFMQTNDAVSLTNTVVTLGETYTFLIDGTKYTYEAQSGEALGDASIIAFGELEQLTASSVDYSAIQLLAYGMNQTADDGTPTFYMLLVLFRGTEAPTECKFLGSSQEIKKLDEMFLPDKVKQNFLLSVNGKMADTEGNLELTPEDVGVVYPEVPKIVVVDMKYNATNVMSFYIDGELVKKTHITELFNNGYMVLARYYGEYSYVKYFVTLASATSTGATFIGRGTEINEFVEIYQSYSHANPVLTIHSSMSSSNTYRLLPSATGAEGAILSIVDGKPAWVSLSSAEEASF